MATEIERKFLVDPTWIADIRPNQIIKSYEIQQGYLLNTKEKVVRIRTNSSDQLAYITIKGARVGNSCPEFEYPIPYADGLQLIAMCDAVIDKTRTIVYDDNKQFWEVDEFRGLNEGLIMAEIELPDEDTDVYLTTWVSKEVSDDPRYTNAQLIYNKAPNL